MRDVDGLVVVVDWHAHPKLSLADVDKAGESEDGDAWTKRDDTVKQAVALTDL